MRAKTFRWAVHAAAAHSAALVLGACLAPALWAPPAWADPPQSVEKQSSRGETKTPRQETDELVRNLERKEKPKFLRVRKNAQGEPIALQTATVRYVAEDPNRELFVDLIGAVHVGDRGYYRQLNDQFEQYDALLYELVAAPDAQVPQGKAKKSDNPVAIAQQLLKTLLDLEQQLESVDYKVGNFVHADLSPDEMAKLIRDRGDTALTLTLGVASDFLRASNLAQLEAQQQQLAAEQPQTAEEMLKFVLNPVKLKRTMARQFDALEGDALGGTLDQILVRDRNQACLKVLHEQLLQGKQKLGIFYGAAHMPDMEKRLLEKYKLKRQSVTWQTAWDLRDRGEPGLEDVLRLLKPLLEE